ncbi:MAG: methyltransferase domain-containing protein [Oscillospiraceae bacterium]|nr:methyltransferase domain-containing protein [Oscillospiraceae bacterium]
MHVFLTGELQIGKSTAIARAVEESGLRAGGFCTTFGALRHSSEKVLCMHRADRPAAMDDSHAVARMSYGRAEIMPEKFDELGCRFLRESKEFAEVIIIDECGRLEADAHEFQKAVLETLDGDIPVLGVLRKGFPGWTREIAERSDVSIVTVTEQNRDSLPEILARWLKSGGKEPFSADEKQGRAIISWNGQTVKWFQNASEYTGFHKKLADMLAEEIEPGSDICDLGCGIGLVDMHLAGRAATITCVDKDETALAALAEDAKKRGITNIKTVHADAYGLKGLWDVVLMVFFGSLDARVTGSLQLCSKKLIAVVHGREIGTLGPEKYKSIKYNTTANSESWLSALGLKWKCRECSLEYGQPFESMEEAERFVRTYTPGTSEEDARRYLAERLVAGENGWPLYLPNKKDFGIFVIEKD